MVVALFRQKDDHKPGTQNDPNRRNDLSDDLSEDDLELVVGGLTRPHLDEKPGAFVAPAVLKLDEGKLSGE